MVFGTDKNWKAWKKRQEERKAEGLGMEAERRTDDDEETEAAKKAQ